MSIPDNAATSETTSPETKTVTDVKQAVSMISVDGEGNYVFPENIELSNELKIAAEAEKRRRDTQSGYTKVQKEKLALEAENAKLREAILTQQVQFTPEQKSELEDLKNSDPDKWRQKINQYEIEAKTLQEQTINSLTSQVKEQAGTQFELQRRLEVLKEFNDSNGVGLTDELLTNEIPPRIHKKLESGTISFEEYLEESLKYLTTTKVIKIEPVMEQPNLSRISGGKEPGQTSPDKSLSELYGNDVY